MLNSKEIAKSALRRVDEIKMSTGRRRKRLEFAGILLCVCAASVTAFVMLPIRPPASYVHVDYEQLPLAAPLLPDNNARPYTEINVGNEPVLMIPNYKTVTIPADAIQINMPLFNPDENNCWLAFELALAETDEILYKSGLVAPSMRLDAIVLSRPLLKGEYETVLNIRALEMDGFAVLSSTSTEIIIIAE